MSGTVGSGLNRRLSIGRQTALKTRAPAGSGKQLRRIQMAPNMIIDAFSSQEILPSQMERTSRAGMGRGQIAYQGEMAPGSQTEFWEGMMRRQFAAVTVAPVSNVTAAAGPPGTFTRAAGSWITDGLRVGMVIRMTGWTSTGVNNNGRNYRILTLTATVMTVSGVGNEAVAARIETGPVTVSVVGKVNFLPPTGQVLPYFTVEDWQPDLAVPTGEVFEDCRVQQLAISLPPTGMAQFAAQMAARESALITSAHFTSPAAPANTASLAGVQGSLRLNGADVATITQLQLQMQAPIQADPSVGANRAADILVGPVQIRASVTAYLTDFAMFTANRAESEFEVIVYLPTTPAINADFMCITMPRVKVMTPQRQDSPLAITQSFQLFVLENTVTTGGLEATNLMIQDSTI
jgi:hypothetical protein